MTPDDALPSIAEIAIGLAGFSGLVAAFSQRPGQPWKGDQKARIVFLIVLSFLMITAALLPSGISGFSDSPALVWGIPMIACSGIALICLVVWVILARGRGYKLQFPVVSTATLLIAGSLQVMVLLSGFGLILPYSHGLFVFGLLSILVFCANMFVALLHITWSD